MSTVAGTIILKRNDAQAETPAGIILPESMMKEFNIGTVLHVGAPKGEMKPEVAPGDVIVFSHKSYRKIDFELDGEDVTKIGFQDVYLISKK